MHTCFHSNEENWIDVTPEVIFTLSIRVRVFGFTSHQVFEAQDLISTGTVVSTVRTAFLEGVGTGLVA